MNLHQLSVHEVRRRLANGGLCLPCGPFKVRIRSPLPHLAAVLHRSYKHFPIFDEATYVDFEVELKSPNLLRRYFRPQVSLSCDGRIPFKPLPLDQAFPMLEWGLNWIISSHAHTFLVLHAAVVERSGRALILAADPGSGKSTLCAALVNQGWRLLSDELALVERETGEVWSISRPISLKNASIDIVRSFRGDVELSPVCVDTAKGAIAHMTPPEDSVAAMGMPAIAALMVFPKYIPDRALISEPVGSAHAFLEIARHAFNLSVLAGDGFDAIARLLGQVHVQRVSYASFDQVIPEIERLWREAS